MANYLPQGFWKNRFVLTLEIFKLKIRSSEIMQIRIFSTLTQQDETLAQLLFLVFRSANVTGSTNASTIKIMQIWGRTKSKSGELRNPCVDIFQNLEPGWIGTQRRFEVHIILGACGARCAIEVQKSLHKSPYLLRKR